MRERKNQSNACWISKLNARNVIVMLLFSAELCILHSQILPSRAAIVEKMTIANSKYMKMWPNPTEPSLPHIAFEWTYGTYFVGDMAMYAITLDSSYYNYAVRWADGLLWEMRNWQDFQIIGQTFVELYQWDPKPERIESVKTWAEGKLGYDGEGWYGWIDLLMIAWPVFAKVQAALYNNNDTRYAEMIYNYFYPTKIELYNATDHLWWRDASFKPPYTEPNGEDCYWSRGNGWVFSGLVRVLDVLPESYPHREEYIRTFIEMAEALRLVQRTDGFWNVSLHDSTHFGGPEETGTAFFTYGIAWGIRKGLLDSSVFLPTVLKAWDALANTALRSDSILGYYQGTGDQPESGQPVTLYSVPNFYDYGVGGFLLAGSEMAKLVDWISISTGMENKPVVIAPENLVLDALPNPFNPFTCISYCLPQKDAVTLTLYNPQGKMVKELVSGMVLAGRHMVQVEAGGLASGIYICELKSNATVKRLKLVLMR